MIVITNLNWQYISTNPSIAVRDRQSRWPRELREGEETMTAFAHVDHPTQHPGIVRAERVAASLKNIVQRLDSARANASLLLAAIVAALMVVANQIIDTWTEGHLLAAWIVMWTVAFAALALLAGPAHRAAVALRSGFKRWGAARKQAASDQKLWEVALTDARVMADISRAMSQDAARDIRAYY
jgi:hypothetical protein